MEPTDDPEIPVLPVVRQPQGLKYYLGTWSGRILLVNAIVFLWMVALEPSSLWVPNIDFVRQFGSKSLSDIALGQYWRFVTPIFVHIGIIHFTFNAMALYYIGYQIEYILGGRWFLILYLISGFMGNLSSCTFSLSPSAGASGALFGLLGAGFRLERLVSDTFDRQGERLRPRKRIYSAMVITNIVLGLVIPVIDNAAHIGGLVTGWFLMEALLRSRPNRLRARKPVIAYVIYAAMALFASFAVLRSIDPETVLKRYYKSARAAESAPEAYQYFTEALRIHPLDPKSRLYRGELLLQSRELKQGIEDIKIGLMTGKLSDSDVEGVMTNLQMTGHGLEAEIVRKLKAESVSTEI